MTDHGPSVSPDHLATLLVDGRSQEAATQLARFERATADERKAAVRAVRDVAEDHPDSCAGVVPSLVSFLDDDERAVRLTTAKALSVLAASTPDAVTTAVGTVADRLGDADEFYYVRARCAETLGYVALAHPDEVATPETLADLCVGLSVDEPEVREKLANALECIAVASPGRLRHKVSALAEHLDDERALVRYHLTTALAAVGSDHPERLTDCAPDLADRLVDDSPQVRGRAAEALGVLAAGNEAAVLPESALEAARDDDDSEFVRVRARFALDAMRAGEGGEGTNPELGTIDGIETTSDDAVEALTSRDDETCPQCETALPAVGPPVCPNCGAPY